LLLRRSAAGTDRMELYVFASADGSQARLVARLDNLGKGASGAAVQSLNLMAGLPEFYPISGFPNAHDCCPAGPSKIPILRIHPFPRGRDPLRPHSGPPA
ncbi:MAG: N-acetyl-gamma-glutamyl-phosphate reductase, partial [Proteobacteria bacterium]|nr:N-acetyl-gamma-glutamyl-phosphate reductase [Pseudomonadota bacterium]